MSSLDALAVASQFPERRVGEAASLCPPGRGVWQPPAPRGAGLADTVLPLLQGHQVKSEDVWVLGER